MNIDHTQLTNCTLCPRNCGVDRTAGITGFCGETAVLRAARAAIHMWEEPCISGVHGSGAVFFSGCGLRCIYCQNQPISCGGIGKAITVSRLADIFLSLQEQKANNINLVTPTHFILQIIPAIELARQKGLSIPIVYNTGSYEKVETLRMLDGLVDVYLPDLKYYSPAISQRCSFAENYFEVASKAIAEMYRQVGPPRFAQEQDTPAADGTHRDISETMLMTRGMIVRHLLLPECEADSFEIVKYLFKTYGDHIYISIMNQYTPTSLVKELPDLNCTVSPKVYDRLVNDCIDLGLEKAFIQEGKTAAESFIPLFDFEGL